MLLYFLPSIQNIASTTFPAEIHISNPCFHLSILYCKNIQRKQGGIGGYSTYSIRNLSVGIEGYRLVDKYALWACRCRAQVCDPDNVALSMKEIQWRCRSVFVGFNFMTNEASILLLFMSERELWRGGPEESSFCFKPGLLYFLSSCLLLVVGCRCRWVL